MMNKLRLQLTTIIRDGPLAAFEILIKLAGANFTLESIDAFTAPGAESAQAGVSVLL